MDVPNRYMGGLYLGRAYAARRRCCRGHLGGSAYPTSRHRLPPMRLTSRGYVRADIRTGAGIRENDSSKGGPQDPPRRSRYLRIFGDYVSFQALDETRLETHESRPKENRWSATQKIRRGPRSTARLPKRRAPYEIGDLRRRRATGGSGPDADPHLFATICT